MTDLSVTLGPVALRSPLIAASGTVGSVVDFAGVSDLGRYGALVAKSVALEPWLGNQPPRMAPAGIGMLNSIGIQNPGIDAWVDEVGPGISQLEAPLWGSAVGHRPEEFAKVAIGLQNAGVAAVEVNLSCPNLDGQSLIALDPIESSAVVAAVRNVVDVPIGAKLSPNAQDIASIALAVRDAGADWVVLTNTAWGARINIETRRPALSAYQGGYSGPPLKPIAMRCVAEVASRVEGLPIVGCGGISSGEDVVEFLMAGASAVQIGSVHFAEPRAAIRIESELKKWCRRHQVDQVRSLTASVQPW